MKKKLMLHAVATDKKTHLLKNTYKFTPEHGNSWEYRSQILDDAINRGYEFYHLYLTSDEEIKEDNIVLERDYNIIFRVGKFTSKAGFERHLLTPRKSDVREGEYYTYAGEGYVQYCRKIVATTNPELWGNPDGKCGGDLKLLGGDGESGEGMAEPLYCRCKKCGSTHFYSEEQAQKGCKTWSTKWIVAGIPKIPASLIQYFVEVQGNVKEVMVEYDGYTAGQFATKHQYFDLKLNPDSTIIWSKVEQKMYTRDELLNALYKFTEGNPDCKTWLNINYPE